MTNEYTICYNNNRVRNYSFVFAISKQRDGVKRRGGWK